MVVVREQITDTWRKIIQTTPGRQGKPWVVFRQGTCVILMEGASSKEGAAAKATQIISEYGPVLIATSSADFNVTENSAAEGIIVTCWHNDVLSFVGKEEGEDDMLGKALLGSMWKEQERSRWTKS